MELKQKTTFNTREFKLFDSKLHYSYSKFGTKNEVVIAFEEISGDKVSHISSNFTLLSLSLAVTLVGIAIIGIVFLVAEPIVNWGLFIFAAVLIIVGIGLFISYWMSRTNYWKIRLNDGRQLFFHKDGPNGEQTEKFIDELYNLRNKFLRRNYMTVDKNLNYESQLDNFRWLRSIHAISQDEFDSLYNELKRTVDPLKTNIGFRD